MKKFLSVLMAVAMTLSLAACGSSNEPAKSSGSAPAASSASSGPAYPKITINISTSGADTGIDTQAANRFAENVSQASGGQITAKVYPQAQLANGDQSKVVEMLAAGGSFEFAIASGANLSSLSSAFQTHQLPFLFSTYEEAEAAFDGAGGAAYNEILNSKGLTFMGALHNGLRHWTNNTRPIVTPEDVKGLKMRIPSGEVGMAVFKALGADPVTINFSELYTALQMGTADGQENGYQTAGAANLYEVQKYVTECAWQYDAWFVIANQATWESYDDATRQLLEETWKEAIQWARDAISEQDQEYKQIFIEKGCEITELTDEQLQAFKDAVYDVKMSFVDKYGEDICKAFGVI
ncbi:DctP family TRAP transporter solute-binding subunit [Dysosmobacter sp.]|uniref:DctP family TRAP transporter solute-binding subunit n=1 Tax=Dysosmobacter sp. TaxID=2591382 RepID=UPI002A8A76BA|nr:DctP family TRAP transporter solute-binding subunit [Dysosmobacter sp.]MDY3281383.1 DctP family TRAP transporter solute-binding subunit [Dysosmobacter sp.]